MYYNHGNANCEPIATSELPSPPFVAVEGVVNFRDIGGYPITGSGSKSVKRGFVYRSAVLSGITNDGMKTLVALGIRVIFDIRSHGEELIPGVVTTRIPVIQFPVYQSLVEKLLNHRLLSDNDTAFFYAKILSAGLFRQVFEHIRDKPEEPFLIHCALGKDRTGVLVALILRIAGVSDLDVVGNEYELTDIGNPPPIWGRYESNLALGKHIKVSMAWLDEEYGGIEGYFKDVLKFQDEDIRKIKKNLVAQEKPT